MPAWEHKRPGRNLPSELKKGNDRTCERHTTFPTRTSTSRPQQATKEKHTYENAKVCSDEVECGEMAARCTNHTTNAREHSCETDD